MVDGNVLRLWLVKGGGCMKFARGCLYSLRFVIPFWVLVALIYAILNYI
jgi:hypothetical protein